MLDMLIYNGILMAPEIAGAAVEGAASLAVSAGAKAGKGLVTGIAEGLGEATVDVGSLAQAAGEGLARGLVKGAVSELGETGANLAKAFFGEA